MSVGAANRVSPLRRGDFTHLGPYRLAGRLGSGGMGVVFLAVDPDGEYVAIKLVHDELADDPEFRARFRSEVERARQVPSYCTAEVLDADLDHHPPYLVVEFVDGPSLAEVVEERGPLTPANLHSVAVGVATAMTGIHGAGVIHRDLKPENVLLAPGSPKVIDFGIARAFESTSQYTRADHMVGTMAYMAPERFADEPGTPLSPAADVFAWGCVVTYAGTGWTPFHGDSAAATAARILTQPPRLGGLAEPLRGLVALSLAKDPADRPTARELLHMLVEGPPMRTAPAIGRQRRPEPVLVSAADLRPARSGGGRLLVTLALLLLLAGVATVITVTQTGARVGNGLAVGAQRGGGAGAAASSTPTAEPTRQPIKPPSPPDPAGTEIIHDALTEPGLWRDSVVSQERAGCVVRDVLRATRVDRGTFQCSGPRRVIADDVNVTVTISLETLGSCAAVWFHWDDNDGGQVMRVCQESFVLAADTPDDSQIFGTLHLNKPIPLGTRTRVRFAIARGTVEVSRGGVPIGRLSLPGGGPRQGQVRLGLSVPAQAAPPPYEVTFADVDIRAR